MYDVAIIGAGIVGLSVAYQLQQARPSLRVCVLEKEDEIAQHQSSHNSGVIHSGIYYQPGSLKAKNCIEGYRLLLEFCKEHQIKHEICGKLIVATSAKEIPTLHSIFKTGQQNGLAGLKWLNTEQAQEIEPYVNCDSAIYVPQAGIIDFRSVAKAYASIFQHAGGTIRCKAEVRWIEVRDDGVHILTDDQQVSAKFYISCAGLHADHVAGLTLANLNMQILPFRGEYFSLIESKKYLVNNLIYPVPNPDFPFLGVHFTRMINGEIEAGPNAVLAYAREGYHHSEIDMKELWYTLRFGGFRKLATKYWRTGLQEFRRSYSKAYFVKSLQKLIPEIGLDDVVRGRSGVRAMACSSEGKLIEDFLIVSDTRGLHVLNAPSPAATASLAIGKEIIHRLHQLMPPAR